MTNEEASRVLKLKMEIHKQMFGKDIDEPLKTAYEMAIKALSAQPDRELIEDYIQKIRERISPHTSAGGVVAINYYLEQIYEQIYGKGEEPKCMI